MLQNHWNWQPIETAPKDGTEILLAMPGGMSDHFYVVYWHAGAWRSRFDENRVTITDKAISRCYLRPCWVKLDPPPTSLCREDYTLTEEDRTWRENARLLWGEGDTLVRTMERGLRH